jgi:hypothetical protein
MKKPENYDAVAHQGATFIRRFTFGGTGPYGTHSLEGWTPRLHIRRDGAEGKIDLECDLDNERLVILDAPNGVLQWKLKPEDTASIVIPKGLNYVDCVYGIELKDPDGDIHPTPVNGSKFRLYRSVTR